MKTILLSAVVFAVVAAGCDVQSDISKRSVEKYQPTPTPIIEATPTPEPIDPADIIKADTSVQGPMLSLNKGENKSVACDKYNRVMVNGNQNTVTIKGACSQIMINGNTNVVMIEAAAEIVFNGSDNEVRYTNYANGHHPTIVDNKSGNIAKKISKDETDK